MEYTILLLLFYCSLQVVAVASYAEQETNFENLLTGQDRENGFFIKYFNVSRQLNDAQLKLQWTVERKGLLAQADDLRCTIERLQQEQNLSMQAEAECREENIQLNTKIQLETGKFTDKILEVQQLFRSNLELNDQKTKEICQLEKKVLIFEAAELRRTNDELKQNQSLMEKAEQQCREHNSKHVEEITNLTQVAQVTREEKLTMSRKIKELEQNLTNKSKEIIELQQNNSNLVLLNRNTAKNAEALQKNVTSMNLSLRNLMEENAKLKRELKNQFNARGEYNRTPLMRAAEYNQASTVKALIDLGANLDLQDNWNNTALILAAWHSNTEICKMLLEAGADVNLRNNDGNTALMFAAWRNNNIEVIRVLLEKGAQVNFANDDGDTVLHLAAEYANVEVSKLLVGHRANINAKAKDGATPLKRALSKNRTEVANYLKSVGATV